MAAVQVDECLQAESSDVIERFDLPAKEKIYEELIRQGFRLTENDRYSKIVERHVDQMRRCDDAHTTKRHLRENEEKYQQMSDDEIAATCVTSSLATSAVVYGVDLAIEGVFLSTVGAELAYAGALVLGPAAIVALGVAAIAMMDNDTRAKKQSEITRLTQEYNRLKDSYNSKIPKLKAKGETLEKQRLNMLSKLRKMDVTMHGYHADLLVQRYDFHGKNILLIGQTGKGKSLLARRILLGDARECSVIEDECESNDNIEFKVAQFGDCESCTEKFECHRKGIKIDGNFMYNLSVIDSPGAADSKGRTQQFHSEMCDYLTQIGGINMFAIFFKFGERIQDNYQDLLKNYVKFWGLSFFNHAVLFITNCDRNTKQNIQKVDKRLSKSIVQIRTFLVSLGLKQDEANAVPVFAFGESNFEKSITDVLKLLANPNETFCDKYECKNVESPIKANWDQVSQTYYQYQKLSKMLMQEKEQMDRIKAQLEVV